MSRESICRFEQIQFALNQVNLPDPAPEWMKLRLLSALARLKLLREYAHQGEIESYQALLLPISFEGYSFMSSLASDSLSTKSFSIS